MGVPKHLQQAGNMGWGGSPLLGAVGTAGHVKNSSVTLGEPENKGGMQEVASKSSISLCHI